eukprot:7872792-Alexandrium_andersonii.AAC.1
MSCWAAPERATAASRSSTRWPWRAWPAASRRWSTWAAASARDIAVASVSVSYTHLRAHETSAHL